MDAEWKRTGPTDSDGAGMADYGYVIGSCLAIRTVFNKDRC